MSNIKKTPAETDKTTTEKVQEKASDAAQWVKDKACEPCSGDKTQFGRDTKEAVFNAADKVQDAVKPDYQKTGEKTTFAEGKKEAEQEKLAPTKKEATTK